MTGKMAVTRYRVKLNDFLPPDDPVVPDLIRLMAAVNDLRTLHDFWTLARSRNARSRTEQQILMAECVHLFRLTCATAYEAGLAFQHFKRTLEKTGRHPQVRARSGFRMLANTFGKDFEKHGKGKVLHNIRISVFHYKSPGKFWEEATGCDMADIIIGELPRADRYLVADLLQSQLFLRAVGATDRHAQDDLSKIVGDTIVALSEVVNEVLQLYIRDHPGAILQDAADSIDPATLWCVRS